MARKKSEQQQARAEELRAQIKRLTKKPGAPLAKQESPAAFVHRRMAELAAKKKQGS